MKNHPINNHLCPHCGATHDRSEGLQPGKRPRDGGVGLCIKCAGVFRFRRRKGESAFYTEGTTVEELQRVLDTGQVVLLRRAVAAVKEVSR